MISTDSLPAEGALEALSAAGYSSFTGVPCSYLTPFIDSVIASSAIDYVGAVNEGDAVAYACGQWLGGRKSVVMFQNSGLGNAVNPLTSLCATFRIPVLVVATLRGDPEGNGDEPQHELMGRITPGLFDLMEIEREWFPRDREALGLSLRRASTHMEERGLPFALLMRKGTIERGAREGAVLDGRAAVAVPNVRPGIRHPADAAVTAVREALADDVALIATTGFTGRALLAVGDRPGQFYMVGSMGCAPSLAFGVARARPDRRVVALDGDGALLMRMGALATIGHERPANLVHVLLDNGVHDSTGAQSTVAPTVDFGAVATACGYARAVAIDSLDELPAALEGDGPLFVHVATEPRSNRELPRPSMTPPEIARRFRAWLEG